MASKPRPKKTAQKTTKASASTTSLDRIVDAALDEAAAVGGAVWSAVFAKVGWRCKNPHPGHCNRSRHIAAIERSGHADSNIHPFFYEIHRSIR